MRALIITLLAVSIFLRVHESEALDVVRYLVELADDPRLNRPLFQEYPTSPSWPGTSAW